MDRVKNLKEHLQTQIRKAKSLSSKWVYILEEEAETCLKLAEAEEEILRGSEAADAEIEGGGSTWWYVCGECHTAIDPRDKYCKECGKRIRWK